MVGRRGVPEHVETFAMKHAHVLRQPDISQIAKELRRSECQVCEFRTAEIDDLGNVCNGEGFSMRAAA
jgi:hypothetical protein